MLGITLIVLVIAEHADGRASLAFEQSARRALGGDANIQIQTLAEDPPDAETVARAANADGVVELSWASDGTKARVHCYLTHEGRWVDREINFGIGTASPERESAERGRLLGFAVATMFTEDKPAVEEPETVPPPAKPVPSTPKPPPKPVPPEPVGDRRQNQPPRRTPPLRKSVEVAGVASSGINGNAAGLGASAAIRLSWGGPTWARVFVAARSGDIPRAQASTRTVQLGAGLALSALPAAERFELGARIDGFAHYFEATHLSEDDSVADARSRWLPGADALVEAGLHLGAGTGLFLGGGVEAVFGRTDIYTHGRRVAVVPPLRAVGEFGFRTRF